jgi:hypothetical protein
VDLLKEITELKQVLAAVLDDGRKKEIQKEIEKKQIEFSLIMERNKSRGGKK